MEKDIKFDAHIRTGGKSYRDPTGWISVPDLIYVNIPTHFDKFSGESVSVVKFYVTLSPIGDPESFVPQDKPNYKAMWEELKADAEKPDKKIECALHACIIAQRIMLKNEMNRIQAKHTPQAKVKKEEK